MLTVEKTFKMKKKVVVKLKGNTTLQQNVDKKTSSRPLEDL